MMFKQGDMVRIHPLTPLLSPVFEQARDQQQPVKVALVSGIRHFVEIDGVFDILEADDLIPVRSRLRDTAPVLRLIYILTGRVRRDLSKGRDVTWTLTVVHALLRAAALDERGGYMQPGCSHMLLASTSALYILRSQTGKRNPDHTFFIHQALNALRTYSAQFGL